mmetsp:Transcript_391/g.571  ORF Transcript_391/g.571 Transcript_391/m.571 type:complete len:259 (+) Transcript_391:675-1451(+)
MVLLPPPDGPTSPTLWPAWTVKLIPFKICTDGLKGYANTTLLNSIVPGWKSGGGISPSGSMPSIADFVSIKRKMFDTAFDTLAISPRVTATKPAPCAPQRVLTNDRRQPAFSVTSSLTRKPIIQTFVPIKNAIIALLRPEKNEEGISDLNLCHSVSSSLAKMLTYFSIKFFSNVRAWSVFGFCTDSDIIAFADSGIVPAFTPACSKTIVIVLPIMMGMKTSMVSKILHSKYAPNMIPNDNEPITPMLTGSCSNCEDTR